MSHKKGYGQFCPVAKASEVVAERWTPLVLRELIAGSRRFSEIQKGVPLMSPSLLSARLKELEVAGIVSRRAAGRTSEYELTEAGDELRPIIEALGVWGQRWVKKRVRKDDLDPALLMWDVRRRIRYDELAVERAVVEFDIGGVPANKRRWWLIVADRAADVCLTWPGFEVDLTVSAPIRTLVAVWMGEQDLRVATRTGALKLSGDRDLMRSFPRWFGLSVFASEAGGA